MNISKIYAVTFVRYTNAMKDTVSDWDGVSTTHFHDRYLKVEPGPFLVREEDLPYYQKFGGGFQDLHLVGYLDTPPVSVLENGKDISTLQTDYATSTSASQDPNSKIEAWN